MNERQRTDTFQADPQAAESTPLTAALTSTPGRTPEPAEVPEPPLPRAFGRYELRRLLGRGGMGRVYLAHDPHLDRLVALKMPTPVAVAGWRERFLAEARAAATLTHPNVCPVHDVGELDGQPYLTMAFLEGETLAARLAREGPLEPADAVELVGTVARAMHVAHRRGVVHRDLKPANLMIAPDGRPVVMDFGLAIRSTSADDLRLTLTGVALGTPAYMPPEQASGEHDDIGPPSDVYSLGVILFELVTGRVPFKAKSFGKLLAQIERDAPPAPSSLNPAVDDALEAVILTALAKAPADRFATAGELADALDRYQEGDHSAITARYRRPYVVPDATGEYLPDAAIASAVAPPKQRSPRRWWVAGAAALLLAAAAGAVIYVQTDYGQLVVQLSDPDSKVDVRVNGQEVTLDPGGGKAVKVKAGANHKLEVTGADFESVAESFDVKRNGVTLARVTLVPKGKAGPPVTGPPGKDPVAAADPPKKEPEKPTPYPKEPTLIETPGWQTLVDATKEQIQAWLDDRKTAKHSVMWLDASAVEGKPVYSAVAALDDREPGWEVSWDLPALQVADIAWLRKRIATEKYYLVAGSAYATGGEAKAVLLWWPGRRNWMIAAAGNDDSVAEDEESITSKGGSARVYRPYPFEGANCWVGYWELPPTSRTASARALTPAGLTEFLGVARKDGNLPVSLAGYLKGGVPTFAVVAGPNRSKVAWEAVVGLTAAELKAKAAEFAAKGFHPSCLTGYPWDGAVRYCVVWVKEPPRPLQPPKEKTLIEVPGWQILADATKEEADAWLADRKKAGHSVMWLDAVRAGHRPVFSAVAALDNRHPEWIAQTEVSYQQLRTGKVGDGVDFDSHALRSASGFARNDKMVYTLLWHHELSRWNYSIEPPEGLRKLLATAGVKNTARILRPIPDPSETARWFLFWDHDPDVVRRAAAEVDPLRVAAHLEAERKLGYLPTGLAAAAVNGQLTFAVVTAKNTDKVEWHAEWGLTAAKLAAAAKEQAAKGFRPDTVTAYAWDGAVRYCVVWIKEPAKEKEPAKTPGLPVAPAPRPKP